VETASRPPLRRLLALDRMVRQGRYPNAASAGRELEVHPRTIHRDLSFLRDSFGAPLEFDPQRNGYFYSDPDYELPLQRLTEGELVALFLAERLLQTYEGTPYAGALTSIFRKLTAALPDEVTINLDHLGEAYSFHRHAADTMEAARFGQLARAVREGRQLELLYWTASRDETCQRVVDPYHLASVQGDWYLVAYCHLREDVRMFSPGRIRSLRETGERFERPKDFAIGAYLDASFRAVRGSGPPRPVRLSFTAEAARYVRERVWHPSQQLRERRDGGLELTVRVSDFLEVKRWVLSYGAACEVLEPAELRAEVEEEVRRTLRLYGGD
jgi:predicted DNA-binding transcriptional regulator YafY